MKGRIPEGPDLCWPACGKRNVRNCPGNRWRRPIPKGNLFFRLAALLQDIAQRAAQARLATPFTQGGRMGFRLDFPLKRQDLADLAGLTFPTTSKLMGKFQRAGLVNGTANNLAITDFPRLQALTQAA